MTNALSAVSARTALAWLREHTSTLTREQLYGFAVILIGGSGVVNGVDGRIETALVSVVTSTLVLLLAAINSRPLMALVYVFLGSVAGLGQIVAVVYDGAGWAVWIGYSAGLLGTAVAFFRVPTVPSVVDLPPAVVELADSVPAYVSDVARGVAEQVLDAAGVRSGTTNVRVVSDAVERATGAASMVMQKAGRHTASDATSPE